MKTNAAPFSLGPTSSPSKKRRWWMYALEALGALLLLTGVVLVWLFFHYTSRVPMPIPKANITQADREALTVKWTQFHADVTAGRPSPPLKISPMELNAFFSMIPRLRDRAYVSVAGDKMQAEISIPLDQFLPVVGKGRYLNGVDVFDVRLGADGVPRVEIVSAKINGKRLPRWLERHINRKEFNQDVLGVMNNAAFLSRLKSMEIRDGLLVITPRNSE